MNLHQPSEDNATTPQACDSAQPDGLLGGHAKFIAVLQRAGFSADDIMLIDYAYDQAKAAHRSQYRVGDQRYFEHPRSVALILLEECNCKDRDMIITALLHDVVEDTSLLGSTAIPGQDARETAAWRLSHTFGEAVSKMVLALSKPPRSSTDAENGMQRHQQYLEQLKNAPDQIMVVKMADRLHNLRSADALPAARRSAKAQETISDYLPLFERIAQGSGALAPMARYLYSEMVETLKQ